MTKDEHRQKHVALHKALDELFADFIMHHPCSESFLYRPIKDLIDWSHQQAIEPEEMK